jgi:hypothetical protein
MLGCVGGWWIGWMARQAAQQHLHNLCGPSQTRAAGTNLTCLRRLLLATAAVVHPSALQVELLGANIAANGSREQMSYTIDCLRRCVAVCVRGRGGSREGLAALHLRRRFCVRAAASSSAVANAHGLGSSRC